MSDWSRIVPLPAPREDPKSWHLEADRESCAALAARFGLIAVDSCVADIELAPVEGGVLARGKVAAAITQRCVVSLEPFAVRIEAPFAIRFLSDMPVDEHGEELFDPEREEDIEPLAGETLDIGEIAAQSLGLALDLHPRRPDLADRAEDGNMPDDVLPEGRQRPFAGLKNIRDMT